MKFVLIRLALSLGLSFVVTYQAIGQTPDAGALQQGIQRQLDAGQMQAPPESFAKEKAPTPVPASKNQTLIDIKGFKVTGMTIVTEAEAQEVLAPFKNRKLTLAQINEAATAISDLYQKKGRIAQAIVPPQDIKDGIVEIKVIEGRVGAIIIEPAFEEDPPRLSSKVTTKFLSYSNPEGGLVDLDGLERSLSLVNEIPGIRAEGSLEPGKNDGTTDIRVKVDELSRFSGRVDVSNYGSASTGAGQAVLSLGLNDLMGIGDAGTIDVIGSTGSVFAQARYYVPGNYDGLRVGIGGSTLSYNTLASFSTISSTGTANTGGFYANYALERTARSNKTINLSLENKSYFNYSNGLEYSNYTINSATLGVLGNQFVGDASWIWSVNAIFGNLNINNTSQATNDQYGAATTGGYGKATIYSAFNQPLPFKKTNALLTINGQWANKNLNTAEQFYLGGPYGVRAYPVTQGGGAQGAIASAELNHTYDNDIKLGVFFDAGVIQQYKSTYQSWQGLTNAGNSYPLYATGLNASYAYKKTEVSGTVAYRVGNNPLYNQTGQQVNVNGYYQAVQFWVKGSLYF